MRAAHQAARIFIKNIAVSVLFYFPGDGHSSFEKK
jgi:hypothetical protein